MNADAFRYLYDYHFAQNRLLWNAFISRLEEEQFRQGVDYSHGSIRDQFVHLISVDEAWFIPLRGVEWPEEEPELPDRAAVQAYFDSVEEGIRGYLAELRDEMLFTKPYPPGEDEDLVLWQVLIHVVNHGTDHRAQILRSLHDLGLETPPQDFIFYVYEEG